MPPRIKNTNHKQSIKPPKPRSVAEPLKRTQPSLSNKVPIQLQQIVLDIFRNTFAPRFEPGFSTTVQQIKKHLFNRDFKSAFGQESFLEAYAMRWSPGRALAYTQIFYHVLSENPLGHQNLNQDSRGLPLAASEVQPASTKQIVCIGGGAGAELVAAAAYLQLIGHPRIEFDDPEQRSKCSPTSFAIKSVDIADWSTVLEKLHSCMTAAPPISAYSSSAAKPANPALITPAACTLSCMQEDVLNLNSNKDLATVFSDVVLVTLMFTLNELYSSSISSTTNLLLSLTMLLKPGTLLLVVDSPGSYSTVNVGKTSSVDDEGTRKRYPMQWLLDHTLLESAAISTSKNTSAERQWKKLESKESEWFRLSNELRYPVSLEDMRYQLHVYRRL